MTEAAPGDAKGAMSWSYTSRRRDRTKAVAEDGMGYLLFNMNVVSSFPVG